MKALPSLTATPLSHNQLSILQRLRQAFGQLPDARQRGKALHRLDEVLLCAFCSILCEGESYTDMEDFTETQLPWLRELALKTLRPPPPNSASGANAAAPLSILTSNFLASFMREP